MYCCYPVRCCCCCAQDYSSYLLYRILRFCWYWYCYKPSGQMCEVCAPPFWWDRRHSYSNRSNWDCNKNSSKNKSSTDCYSTGSCCSSDNSKDCRNNNPRHRSMTTGGRALSCAGNDRRGRLADRCGTAFLLFSHCARIRPVGVAARNKRRRVSVLFYKLRCSWRKLKQAIKEVNLISWQMI